MLVDTDDTKVASSGTDSENQSGSVDGFIIKDDSMSTSHVADREYPLINLLKWIQQNVLCLATSEGGAVLSMEGQSREAIDATNILRAKVVNDPNTGRSKGYVFVKFADEMERNHAMKETTLNLLDLSEATHSRFLMEMKDKDGDNWGVTSCAASEKGKIACSSTDSACDFFVANSAIQPHGWCSGLVDSGVGNSIGDHCLGNRYRAMLDFENSVLHLPSAEKDLRKLVKQSGSVETQGESSSMNFRRKSGFTEYGSSSQVTEMLVTQILLMKRKRCEVSLRCGKSGMEDCMAPSHGKTIGNTRSMGVRVEVCEIFFKPVCVTLAAHEPVLVTPISTEPYLQPTGPASTKLTKNQERKTPETSTEAINKPLKRTIFPDESMEHKKQKNPNGKVVHFTSTMTVGPEFGPCFLINPYILTSDVKTDSRIKRVLDNFDFQGKSGLVQFWECWASRDPEDNGCYLLLTDHLRESDIRDNRLEAYRWTCLNDNYRFVGREKNVGNWFAGRAAQTQVADYQYDGEASGMGQLVVPVYHPGAVLKLAGIIEIVTAQRNETYAADFNQIQSSLMKVNLTSTYLGKTIKVQHNVLVKFTLPFLAKRADLQEQVIMRFNELENKAFSIAYKDTNNIHHSIKSDHDLQSCIADSISNRTTLIRMFVEDVICGDHVFGFLPRRLALRVAFNLGRAITSKKTFSGRRRTETLPTKKSAICNERQGLGHPVSTEPVQLSQISPIPGIVSSGPTIHNGPAFHQERLAFQRHWSGLAHGMSVTAKFRARKEAEQKQKAMSAGVVDSNMYHRLIAMQKDGGCG
ncbi:PB1 domain-containing protein [Tanacetum coccineum]|uniref:PB1 domain-containing protein n=1 Tax=Tanacetum coccineum TaxID=301880 RepID=A0ABQ4Z446_9ASTR